MKTNKNKIAKILAQAFFEFEEKPTIRKKYLLSLQKIVLLMDTMPKLHSFLVNPAFSWEEKEILFSLTNLPKSVSLFLNLIIKKGLISHLKTITSHYEALLFLSLKKERIKMIVAHSYDVSSSIEGLITRKMEQLFKQKIEIDFEVDPALIGGFRLETKEFYLDTSIKKALEDLRNSL